MIQKSIHQAIKKLIEEKHCLKKARMLEITDAIRAIAPYQKDVAIELFDGLNESNISGNVVNLSYYVLAAKSLGYSSKKMKPYLETIENKKMGGEWSSEIWVNALALRALGAYGISYPKYVDGLVKHQLNNGSWFDKIWVSSFALMALYYSKAEEDSIKKTLSYLKNHIKNDHWKEYNHQGVTEVFSSSLALESVLLVGEGYEEPGIQDVVNWCVTQVNESSKVGDIARLLVPLVFIDTGRASKKTTIHTSSPVVFRETKVTIGTQVQGDLNQPTGDLIMGDKVDRKLGDGAIDMKDAVVHRSNINTPMSENSKSFNVCPYCGESLSLKKAPRFCPYCGEELV
jgi:hypothetical protein